MAQRVKVNKLIANIWVSFGTKGHQVKKTQQLPTLAQCFKGF